MLPFFRPKDKMNSCYRRPLLSSILAKGQGNGTEHIEICWPASTAILSTGLPHLNLFRLNSNGIAEEYNPPRRDASVFVNLTRIGYRSIGANFTRKLYFYAEVDLPNGKERSVTNEELLKELGELVDTSEEIGEIWYYTHPLSGWRIVNSVAYHAYVVFKTDQWWWSIEKNDACVILQRSKKIEFVRNHCIRSKRNENILDGVTCTKQKKVKRTVQELVEHIHKEGYLNIDYHFLEKNCQEFADNVYGFF